ncbi:maltose permease [Aspergillus bertholletiae]|uniref:Maltose permease n=1 Tax=Aspergillus bertholletiae TaxID=1226010 RepID=A0A5N7B9V1_9EURO|nr:maltose permease [Aspergillus bertholletiae]
MSDQRKTSVEHVELEAIKGSMIGDNHEEQKLTFVQLLKQHPRIIAWSIFWCMCALGWGFDTQVNGAMVSVPAFREYYGYVYKGSPVIPANWLSAFNVISSVGQFFGGFLCSYVADRIGRKKSLTMGVIIATGGIFGETFSSSRGAFIVSKLILGVGVGFYLTLGPITCSEISPVVLRGLSSAGVNLAIAVGQLASNAATKGFGDRNDVWAFRGPFLVQILFSIILFIGSIFSPESPYYLVRQGRMDEAKRSLKALFGAGTDITSALTTIQNTVNAEQEASAPSYLSAFRGTDRIRTLISIGVFTCQHLAGIVFVLSFSTYFFQLAGLSTSNAFDLGVGVTACGVAGNFCSWFLVNRVGRRPIFLGGMAGCTTVLLLIGILDVIPTGAAQWAQASLTVVYAFVYFLTIGAVAFVLLGEVSSLQLRARTTALATATQAIWGIIMFFVVPYMVNPDSGNLKGKVGFIFGGMSLLTTLVSFFYIPELKGKTYEEIDLLFRSRVPPRKMGSHHLDQE